MDKENIHFIVGPHRSGTTYLQTLLGCMPCVGTGVETHFFCRIRPYLQKLAEIESRKLCFADIRQAIEKIMFQYNEVIADWDDLNKAWELNGWNGLFYSLISAFYVSNNGDPIKTWIEKTPEHLKWINEIHHRFPSSKFVIIFRDPRAVAVSLLKYIRDITRFQRLGYLKNEWVYLTNRFQEIQFYFNLKASYIFLVRYEELASRPYEVLPDICRFLDITYSKPDESTYLKCVSNITLNSEVHKSANKSFRLSYNPIPWDSDLSFLERAYLDISFRHILQYFGYPPKYSGTVLPDNIVQILVNLWNKWLKEWHPHVKPKKSIIEKYIPWSPSYTDKSGM
jgi:hypothetical protein